MPPSYQTFISSERLRKTVNPGRSLADEMLDDKVRILTSSAFRRLQTKAQVFSLETNAGVRSRLTHTLEVSIFGQLIAEQIVNKLVENKTLEEEYRLPFVTTVENACLLHDVGNPPFGHLGEYAIQDWFKNNQKKVRRKWKKHGVPEELVNKHIQSFRGFDGNPQGFRIVTRLLWLSDEYGLNLTCTLLASIIKYLVPSSSTEEKKSPFGEKVGYFETERSRILEIWERLGLNKSDELPLQRHPLTFIMEAADDIAYSMSDIEDGIEKGIISEDDFFSFVGRIVDLGNFGPYDRESRTKRIEHNQKKRIIVRDAEFIGFRTHLTPKLIKKAADEFLKNEEQIINGKFEKHLLDVDDDTGKVKTALQEFARDRIYTSHEAVDIELSGYRIIQDILSGFFQLLDLSPEEFARLSPKSESILPKREYSLHKRLYTLLPKKHLLAYENSVEKDINHELEPVFRTHLIVDYLAGMTDSHAVKVFNMISGIWDQFYG